MKRWKNLASSGAIVVVHSLAGALGALLALDYPQRVAGLVMLAPVAYPWPGGVGWYNKVVTTPVIGPLLAYTITLPLGLLPDRTRRPQRVRAADHAGRILSGNSRRRCCCGRANFSPTPGIW